VCAPLLSWRAVFLPVPQAKRSAANEAMLFMKRGVTPLALPPTIPLPPPQPKNLGRSVGAAYPGRPPPPSSAAAAHLRALARAASMAPGSVQGTVQKIWPGLAAWVDGRSALCLLRGARSADMLASGALGSASEKPPEVAAAPETGMPWWVLFRPLSHRARPLSDDATILLVRRLMPTRSAPTGCWRVLVFLTFQPGGRPTPARWCRRGWSGSC